MFGGQIMSNKTTVSCIKRNQAKNIEVSVRDGEKDVFYADIEMTFDGKVCPGQVSFTFNTECADVYSTWTPLAKQVRHIAPDWSKQTSRSRLASGAPVMSMIAKNGANRVTVALSDANTACSIGSGVLEDCAELQFKIDVFTQLTAPLEKYNLTVRIDMRDVPYYTALSDTEKWWREELGFSEAYVPEAARVPLDSLWYSFHQALDPDKVIEECRLSKSLGMDTVIIDDGWQTDDNGRGYDYCGDWELATGKIPDMKKLVDALHEIGMKVILWYSVPFVGCRSKNYERFKGMYVCSCSHLNNVMCLDPRFKEVRDFMVDIYKKAVSEWGLDGLKLDFIDSFALSDISKQDDPRRDCISLEEGVEKLLSEVTNVLKAIDPEILIEFRQSYIGPTIRKYGNMLRVSDCPNDAIRNKIGIVDLRLISGGTAVHSDMLMWHKNEKPEQIAFQLLSTMFGVPQISVRLCEVPEEHKLVIKNYLDFWRANRSVVLDGKLAAKAPEDGYLLVSSEKDGREVAVRYADVPFELKSGIKYSLFNATSEQRAVLLSDDADCKDMPYEVYDCLGNKVASGVTSPVNGSVIRMPISGRIDIG